MTQIPESMMKHKVWVTPFLGTNAIGEVFGTRFRQRCMFGYHRKMVRNAQGEMVNSSSFVITVPDFLPRLGSVVETPEGERRKIIALDRPTWPGVDVPANTKAYLD